MRKHFNYNFNNENNRKKTFTVLFEKIIHKENPSIIFFLTFILSLKKSRSKSLLIDVMNNILVIITSGEKI
jgi:hypothetical protein